jgi:hypothetical protein
MALTHAMDTPFQHPPSASAREKLEHRQVLRAGTSPFADEPKAEPIDRTWIVSCSCCSPPRKFLNDTFLAKHVERAAIDREQANARRRQTYAKQRSKVR